MHPQTLFGVFTTMILFTAVTPIAIVDPLEIGSPCGASAGDCSSLTCIPVSANCTSFKACPGTCRDLTNTVQQVYTRCGGWYLMDDCDERIEICLRDPRRSDGCGPECDGMGICAPRKDVCGGDTGRECEEGKVCFRGERELLGTSSATRICFKDVNAGGKLLCGGVCFPLRFGSDTYGKSGLVEVLRVDQDGWQREPDD